MNTECTFAQLRASLATAPVLVYPNPKRMFSLDTEASNVGLGLVLSQSREQGEQVVAYYSHALSPPGGNYCVTCRELLAVMAAQGHFRPYSHG